MFGNKGKYQGIFGTLKINSNAINENNQFKLLFNENKSITTSKDKSTIFKDLPNKRNNTNSLNKQAEKCNHKNFFVSYCTEEKKNCGLICYECLYKYHTNHISKCMPIRKKPFKVYLNLYKKSINKYKYKLAHAFGRINTLLDHLEKEKIEDISTLFEKKLDLNFELPIEISIKERLDIAINNRISEIIEEEIDDVEYKYLNLFKYDLDKLVFSKNNPNDIETIKFESSVDFKLFGIGIPILKAGFIFIKAEIYEGNTLLDNKIKYHDDDKDKRLSIGIFTNPVKIKKDIEYTLVIKEIKGLLFIDEDKQYNENSKIKISSSNLGTILACLIIK